MNADHTLSLSKYLEAFTPASHLASRHPTLTDITPASLTLRSSRTLLSAPREYTIPLSPPLPSLGSARARMVELDAVASAKLGREPQDAVTRFVPPTPLEYAVMAGVVAGMVLFTDGAYFAPESVLGRTLFAPGFMQGARSVCEGWHWWIWGVIMGLHVSESGVL
ncbi:MAG: hypothetical protein LQ340_007130, partial [Diploschistes diacapsis]